MTKETTNNNHNIIGNGSTILKYILIMIATKIIAVALANGINLPLTAVELAEILGYLLGFIIATIDAKYPNNIFHNVIELGILKIDETEHTGEDDEQ